MKLYPDIKMILVILLFIPVAPQDPATPTDPPKVTYEDSGDFRMLVKELELKFGGRIRFGGKVPRKDITISVRDAGFYEALDALCRLHKEATYFGDHDWGMNREQLTIGAGSWVEYPAAYHGHFKVALTSMMRTLRTSPEGDAARANASLVLFAPPWIQVGWSSGTVVEWAVDEARDAEGKDVRTPGDQRFDVDRIGLDFRSHYAGNLSVHSIGLRDLDLTKGLKVLAGKVKLTAAETKVERLAAKAGESVEIPQGRLVVDSVTEQESDGDATSYRIAVTFKPKDAKADESSKLERILERRARTDGGQGEWLHVDFPWQGRTFEIQTHHRVDAPSWIELRVRISERVHEVPFRFKDVAFRGE